MKSFIHGLAFTFWIIWLHSPLALATSAENKLILDVVQQLQNYENAQSVIVISDKSKINLLEEHLFSNDIALTLFDAASVPGVFLTQSGEICPYLMMIFETKQNAVDFLETHDTYLRFLE